MSHKSVLEQVQNVSSLIEAETKLTARQAEAVVLKEIVGVDNDEFVEMMGVSSLASASSYVSKSRTKFSQVNEEISELEQEIEMWEKTKQLEGLLNRFNPNSSDTDIQQFSYTVQQELVDNDEETFLVAYVDDQGNERVKIADEYPRVTNSDAQEDVEILEYKRINSYEELFGVDNEDEMFLMAYIDGQGKEEVKIINTHPRLIETNNEDIEILEYKQIHSYEQLFD
jgi:phage terminase small subunit